MQLFADTAPDTVTWTLFIALAGLVVGVLAVVAAFIGLRRTPPLAEEIHAKFARSDDLKSLETEFEKKVVAIHARMDTTFATMSGTLLGMAKSLGAIEGKLAMRQRRHSGGEGE